MFEEHVPEFRLSRGRIHFVTVLVRYIHLEAAGSVWSGTFIHLEVARSVWSGTFIHLEVAVWSVHLFT